VKDGRVACRVLTLSPFSDKFAGPIMADNLCQQARPKLRGSHNREGSFL